MSILFAIYSNPFYFPSAIMPHKNKGVAKIQVVVLPAGIDILCLVRATENRITNKSEEMKQYHSISTNILF